MKLELEIQTVGDSDGPITGWRLLLSNHKVYVFTTGEPEQWGWRLVLPTGEKISGAHRGSDLEALIYAAHKLRCALSDNGKPTPPTA